MFCWYALDCILDGLLTASGQEDLDALNVLHVKSCPYLPGTANRYSISSRSSRLSLKQSKENVDNEDNNSESNSNSNLNTNNMNNESKMDFNISPSFDLAHKTASYQFAKQHKTDQRSFNDSEAPRNGRKTSNDFDALDHHHHHNQLLLYHQQPEEYHEYQKLQQHHHNASPASSSSPVYHDMMCHPHFFMQQHHQQPHSRHPSSSCTEASSIHDSQDLTGFDIQGLRKRSFKQRILPSKSSSKKEDVLPSSRRRSRDEEDDDDDLFRSPSSPLVIMGTPTQVMSVSEELKGKQAWMSSPPLSQNNIDFDCDYTSSSHSNVNLTPNNTNVIIGANNNKKKLTSAVATTTSTTTTTSTSTANNKNNNNNLNNKNNTATSNNIASEANRIKITCWLSDQSNPNQWIYTQQKQDCNKTICLIVNLIPLSFLSLIIKRSMQFYCISSLSKRKTNSIRTRPLRRMNPSRLWVWKDEFTS